MTKALRNKKGFTLVEILVVLAILAILIAVAVPSLSGALEDAKDKTALANARAAYIAYELKSATSDSVTATDIGNYMGNTAPKKMAVSVKIEGGNVAEFYYTDNTITNKHIKIVMGEKASVEAGAIPTSGTGVKDLGTWNKPPSGS